MTQPSQPTSTVYADYDQYGRVTQITVTVAGTLAPSDLDRIIGSLNRLGGTTPPDSTTPAPYEPGMTTVPMRVGETSIATTTTRITPADQNWPIANSLWQSGSAA